MGERNKLKIDTDKRNLSLDDVDLKNVSRLDISWLGGSLATINIQLDGDVEVTGTLLNRDVAKLHCDKCGFTLANGVWCYDVICPKCGNHCFGC